jgi:hypothetical protein
MITALGFMPGSYAGRTRLGYASGSPAHGLGSISPGEYAFAIQAGFSQGDLDTLDAMGATDAQIDSLIQGEIDVPGLMQQLSGTQPTQPITGATMQYEPTDWPSLGIESKLAQLNSDISTLENWVATTPAIANAITGEVKAERDQYNSWAAQYQGYVNQTSTPYVLHHPDGSIDILGPPSQAGVMGNMIVVGAILVALAVAIDYAINTVVAGTTAKAQAANEASIINQSGALITQANNLDQQANAVATSNPSLAAQLHAQASTLRTQGTQQIAARGTAAPGSTPAPSTPTSGVFAWIQQNWQLSIAFGVLTVVLIKRK